MRPARFRWPPKARWAYDCGWAGDISGRGRCVPPPDHAFGHHGLIWWGTIGFHKNPAFSEGTRALVQAMAESSAFTMAAGDDSVAAARATSPEHAERLGCLSGGGSATLALLSGKKLPGVEALRGMGND